MRPATCKRKMLEMLRVSATFPLAEMYKDVSIVFPQCGCSGNLLRRYFSLDRNVQGRFHCISAMRMRRKLIMEKFFSRLKCTRTFPLHFCNADAAETYYGEIFLSTEMHKDVSIAFSQHGCSGNLWKFFFYLG